MSRKGNKVKTVFVFFLLAVLAVLGLGIVVVSNLSLSTKRNDRSYAADRVEQTNLGLKASVASVTQDVVSIEAKWDKSWTKDPNLLYFTGVVRAASQYKGQYDNRRQNDDTGRRIDKNQNRTVFENLPMCPGAYDVVLRAYYNNNTVRLQTTRVEYEGPEVSEGKILVGNTSFESKFNDPKAPGDDLDPDCWEVIEGRATPGTGKIVEEKPSMIQVVGQTGNIVPKTGNLMIVNNAEYNLKSHIRYFIKPVNSGTLVWKFSLYIPEQSKFLNQAEIRKAAGGENIHIRWTNEFTRYCWRLTDTVADDGKQYCKEIPALTPNTWHTFEIRLRKLANSTAAWQSRITLDGSTLTQSNGSSVPHLQALNDRFGVLFLGDECQNGEQQECEGVGTFYYDDVEAYSTP